MQLQASLLQRLGLLEQQQEDAKELKRHVARCERALREVLVQALSTAELHAYSALLVGKATVLAQQRSLDKWVRLQDQLDTVRRSGATLAILPHPTGGPGPQEPTLLINLPPPQLPSPSCRPGGWGAWHLPLTNMTGTDAGFLALFPRGRGRPRPGLPRMRLPGVLLWLHLGLMDYLVINLWI